MENKYLIRFYGDLAESWASHKDCDGLDMLVLPTKWAVRNFLVGLSSGITDTIDIEDDAIEVFEVGDRLTLIWGFWGWHYEPKMEQGFIIEDDEIRQIKPYFLD